MKKYIKFTYIFGFMLTVIGIGFFMFKFIIVINEYPSYNDFMLITIELAPGFGMGLIGLMILVVSQTIRTKQNDKDRMQRFLKHEKFRRE